MKGARRNTRVPRLADWFECSKFTDSTWLPSTVFMWVRSAFLYNSYICSWLGQLRPSETMVVCIVIPSLAISQLVISLSLQILLSWPCSSSFSSSCFLHLLVSVLCFLFLLPCYFSARCLFVFVALSSSFAIIYIMSIDSSRLRFCASARVVLFSCPTLL